jgi:hypothetical protein
VGSYSPANSLASVVFPDRLLARAGLYAGLYTLRASAYAQVPAGSFRAVR